MHGSGERWLCIHFPRLALEVLERRAAGNRPIAVTSQRGNRRWIHDCDASAARSGIEAGMALATAYALLPDLRVWPRRTEEEAIALERLAGIAHAFSSRISLQPPDALLLEAAGSRRLFGSSRKLAQRLCHELARSGHQGRCAEAPTPATARLLIRAGRYTRIEHLSPLPESLGSIPVRCCDLPADTIAALEGVGAHSLRQVLELPRAGLGQRFGQELTRWLDRVTGRGHDPLECWQAPSGFVSELELPAEVPETEGLLFGLQRLVEELAQHLRLRDLALQQLGIELTHTPPASPTRLSLGLQQPDRDPDRLLELLRERLHDLRLPAPVRALRLDADRLLPHRPLADDLFEQHGQREHDWSRLLERWHSRLGRDAVFSPGCWSDHRPERAWRADPERSTLSPPTPTLERPLWLIDPPRPLGPQPLQIISGPERIESGWWDGEDVRRDYFVAESRHGSRLWIYRDLRRGGAASWYLQGIFA